MEGSLKCLAQIGSFGGDAASKMKSEFEPAPFSGSRLFRYCIALVLLVGCAWAGHKAALAVLPAKILRPSDRYTAGQVVRLGTKDGKPVLASPEQRVVRQALFAAENGLALKEWLSGGRLIALEDSLRAEVVSLDGEFVQVRTGHGTLWIAEKSIEEDH